jgi:uncharacterized membrane protein
MSSLVQNFRASQSLAASNCIRFSIIVGMNGGIPIYIIIWPILCVVIIIAAIVMPIVMIFIIKRRSRRNEIVRRKKKTSEIE